ncbi:sugar isomerase domain-containing protein [Streptomyces sp. NPDC001037]|uniref:sugar isomerase domain-containing protein n=1 Tax=Streptomyces sp. NPDC001037 TaxID=3364542 RepID=UPI0036C83816
MSDQPRKLHAQRVRDLLSDVDDITHDDLGKAADLMLDAVSRGGLIYAAGAGHSLAMVCETFYRAGGLAAVRPLWHPSVLPLSSALGSSIAERKAGLGYDVVNEAAPRKPDVAIVFSTSGSNPYPVEVAIACAGRGVPVIAVTSRQASEKAALRTSTRLSDHAVVVLDTAVPPGDVIYPREGPRTAAVSTIAAAYLWSQLLVELDIQAARSGVKLPRWVSANTDQGDEANASLMEHYSRLVPELGAPA